MRWSMETHTQYWNVCVCEFVYSALRKGGGRPSLRLVGVVLACVYTAYCSCSSENNGIEASKMVR